MESLAYFYNLNKNFNLSKLIITNNNIYFLIKLVFYHLNLNSNELRMTDLVNDPVTRGSKSISITLTNSQFKTSLPCVRL